MMYGHSIVCTYNVEVVNTPSAQRAQMMRVRRIVSFRFSEKELEKLDWIAKRMGETRFLSRRLGCVTRTEVLRWLVIERYEALRRQDDDRAKLEATNDVREVRKSIRKTQRAKS